MANQFQYVKLPDGSYGKFPGDAGDDVIRGQILKDFPSVAAASRPGMPQSARPSPVSMHPSRISPFNDANEDPTKPTSMADAATAMVAPMARMSKVAGQTVASGLLRKHSPFGQPDMNQFKSDAVNVGTGMALGAMEAPEPEVRFAPRLDESAAPSVNSATSSVNRSAVGAAGGATRSTTGTVLDMASHVPGKIGMASKLLRKMGIGDSAVAAADTPPAPQMVRGSTAPMPHDRAGLGVHGTPVSEWGNTIQPEAPRPPVARPAPAWQKLQRPASFNPNADMRTAGNNFDIDQQAQRQAEVERDNGKLPPNTSYVQRSQQIKDSLIKGAGGNGATVAAKTPAQVTPDSSAGDTVTHLQGEDARLNNAGGQFGKPTAVGKLQKASAKPSAGLSKLETKQAQMRLRNRLKKTNVTGEE